MKISTDLNATIEYPSQIWSWWVTEFPVDYSDIQNRCDSSKLGKKLVSMDDVFGYLLIPENKTTEFEAWGLEVTGHAGIYGKSLLLQNHDTKRYACSSIAMLDKTSEKIAVATFNSPVFGDVFFRWFSTKDHVKDMLITADLYHVADVEKLGTKVDFSEHSWKIYATDILEAHKGRTDENCNSLQIVFDPGNRGRDNAFGDVDTRVGKLKISTDGVKRRYKSLFRDEELVLLPSDLKGQRKLYLVIFESKHKNSFLACAKIRYGDPINAR